MEANSAADRWWYWQGKRINFLGKSISTRIKTSFCKRFEIFLHLTRKSRGYKNNYYHLPLQERYSRGKTAFHTTMVHTNITKNWLIADSAKCKCSQELHSNVNQNHCFLNNEQTLPLICKLAILRINLSEISDLFTCCNTRYV